MMPSWLAPNFELAEPRVERFAQRVAGYLGKDVKEFWACVPWEHYFEDREGNRWVEAWFCLRIEGNVYVPIAVIDGWRKTIDCFSAEFSEVSECTEILLSARVLR